MPHHPAETAHADCDKTATLPDEQLLDDALKETFPASDPISPSSTANEKPPAPAPPPPAPSDEPIPFPTAKGVADAQADTAILKPKA